MIDSQQREEWREDRDRGDEGRHTTVIGMEGALGKIKETSSYISRRRQFWAIIILQSRHINKCSAAYTEYRAHRIIPACSAVRVRLEVVDSAAVARRITHVSPRPWAMMTVAVCLLRAGTTNGAFVAMVTALSVWDLVNNG